MTSYIIVKEACGTTDIERYSSYGKAFYEVIAMLRSCLDESQKMELDDIMAEFHALSDNDCNCFNYTSADGKFTIEASCVWYQSPDYEDAKWTIFNLADFPIIN